MWGGLKSLRGALNNVAAAVKEGVSVVNLEDLSDEEANANDDNNEDEGDDENVDSPRGSPGVTHESAASGTGDSHGTRLRAEITEGLAEPAAAAERFKAPQLTLEDVLEERRALEQQVQWLRGELTTQTELVETWQSRYGQLEQAATQETSASSASPTAASASSTAAAHALEDLQKKMNNVEADAKQAAEREAVALDRLRDQERNHKAQLREADDRVAMLNQQVAGLKQAVRDAAELSGGCVSPLPGAPMGPSEQGDAAQVKDLEEQNEMLRQELVVIKETMREMAVREAEASRLKSMVKDSAAQQDALAQQLTQARNENSALTASLDKLRAEQFATQESFEKELNSTRIAQLNTSNDEMEERHRIELETGLAEASKAAASQLNAELQQLEAAHAAQLAQADVKAQELGELLDEAHLKHANALAVANEDAERHAAQELAEAKLALEAQVASTAGAEVSAALAEAASLDEQLKAASTAYDAKLTSQRTELMNEMEAASSSAAARIANLDSLNVHLKAELHELANSSAMQAENLAAASAHAGNSTRIVELEEQLVAAQCEVQEQREARQALKKRIREQQDQQKLELEAAIAEVRQQQQQQQQQLNDQTLAPSSSRSSSDETSSFGTPTELLEQKLRTAVDALEKVERKLATQAGRLRAAEGDVERLTAELDAKEEIEESLMHDKEELEDRLEEVQASLPPLQAQLAAAQAAKEEIEGNVWERDATIEDLQDRIAELESEGAASDAHTVAVNGENASVSETQLAELQQKLAQATAESAKLRDELNETKKRHTATLETLKAKALAKVRAMQESNRSLKHDKEQLVQQLATIEAAHKLPRGAASENEDDQHELLTENQKLRADVVSLKEKALRKVHAMQEAQQQLESKYSAVLDEHHTLQENHKAVQQSHADTNREAASTSQKAIMLENELRLLHQEHESLQLQMDQGLEESNVAAATASACREDQLSQELHDAQIALANADASFQERTIAIESQLVEAERTARSQQQQMETKHQSEIAQLHTDLSNVRQRYHEALETKQQIGLEAGDALRSEAATQRALAEARAELESLRQARDTLHDQVRTVTAAADEAQTSLERHANASKLLKEELDEAKAASCAAEEAVAESKRRLESSIKKEQSEMEATASAMVSLEAQLADQLAAREQLDDEKQALQIRISELSQAAEDYVQELAVAHEQVAAFSESSTQGAAAAREQLQTLTQELDEAKVAKTRVETEMRARTTDFAKKDNAIAALQSELRDTRSDLQATLAFLEVEVLAQPSNHTV